MAASGDVARESKPTAARRILCLHFPHLATDRVRLGHDEAGEGTVGKPAARHSMRSVGDRSSVAASRGDDSHAAGSESAARSGERRALVLTRRVGSTIYVSYACPRAREAGVEAGVTLGEAMAVAGDLQTLDHEEHADHALLLQLAEWATAYSPLVEPLPPATLLLDITGCRRLFAPRGTGRAAAASASTWSLLADRRLAEHALGSLLRDGLHAAAAVADTVGAAYALAVAGREALTVVPEGETVGYISPLPPAVLRIEPRVVEALDRLGVRTIGDLLLLPQASLAARFGPQIVRRMQQALGAVHESITPYLPEPPAAVRVGFETTVRDRVAIQRVASRLLDDLLPQVFDRERALRRLDCVLIDEHGTPNTLAVNFSRATRAADRVRELVQQKLESANLTQGVAGVHLVAGEVVRWRARQGDLFLASEPGNDEQLGELLDRLTNRLGRQNVVQAELVEDYQPEQAFRYVPMGEVTRRGAALLSLLPRPTQLLERPIPIRVTATTPDGPPTWFAYAGREFSVVDAWGPERIETAWWRGSDVRRDYFRVASDSGEQFWVFFDAVRREWYLHGMFV